MNPQPLALEIFKRCWYEMAAHYPVNNNDAALIFRAMTDLIVLPHTQLDILSKATLDERIEQVVASFPEAIAPLCRNLAHAYIEALSG